MRKYKVTYQTTPSKLNTSEIEATSWQDAYEKYLEVVAETPDAYLLGIEEQQVQNLRGGLDLLLPNWEQEAYR